MGHILYNCKQGGQIYGTHTNTTANKEIKFMGHILYNCKQGGQIYGTHTNTTANKEVKFMGHYIQLHTTQLCDLTSPFRFEFMYKISFMRVYLRN